MSEKKLTYEKDCWEGISVRSKKDAFAEFLVQAVSYLPRGWKHDSFFNKIRKLIIKTAGVKIGLGSYIYPGIIMVCPKKY